MLSIWNDELKMFFFIQEKETKRKIYSLLTFNTLMFIFLFIMKNPCISQIKYTSFSWFSRPRFFIVDLNYTKENVNSIAFNI